MEKKELKKIKSYIAVIRTKLNDRLRGIKPRKQCIRTDVPGISLFHGMDGVYLRCRRVTSSGDPKKGGSHSRRFINGAGSRRRGAVNTRRRCHSAEAPDRPCRPSGIVHNSHPI